MDMTEFTLAKGQQVNADDLVGGPRTIKITGVSGNAGNKEQPVVVAFEGDEGKPFLPCKTMRRLMVAAWGADAAAYRGRSMTLYRDPTVKFGGMEMGGVRISHMSHIDADLKVALTSTRGKRGMVHVKPLKAAEAKAQKPEHTEETPPIDRDQLRAQMEAVASDAQAKGKWWRGLTEEEQAVVKELAAEKEGGE